MQFPDELLYTKDHEWTRTEKKTGKEDVVTIGITDHAQAALGEVVYVDLPKIGRELKAHEAFGVVESIKAVSDLYSPIAGTVTEVNSALPNDPSAINKDPYTNGWLIRVRPADKNQLSELLDVQKYKAYVEALK